VSTLLTITIGGAALTATTTTLTVTPANVTAGATVSMSASVAGPSGSTGTPTGTVTFLDGSTQLGTGTLNSSGVAAYSTTSLAVGAQSITTGYRGETNFAASTSSPVVVTVTAAAPSFTVSGTAVSVAPGASTGNTSTVTVTPAGGFTGSVALTAVITGSPTGAQGTPTLSFGSASPVTVPSSGVGTATLTITTTPASNSSLAYPKRNRGQYILGGAALACIVFFGIPLRRRSWRRTLGLVVGLAFLTLGVLSCGGLGGSQSIPGTTAGTYTVTVTGTSGTEITTAKITLTVQ
jgi:Big-like domain-containing protein